MLPYPNTPRNVMYVQQVFINQGLSVALLKDITRLRTVDR